MPLLNFEFKQLIEICVGRKIQNFVFWFSFFDTYKYGNKIFQKSNFLDIFRNKVWDLPKGNPSDNSFFEQ